MIATRNSATFIAWRFYLLLTLLTILTIGLISRVILLGIFFQDFLQKENAARVLRQITIPAFRGMILDRNHYPLAVSTKVFSVWINPQEFTVDSSNLIFLADILQLPRVSIVRLAKVYKKQKKDFAYLKRNISPQRAQQIKILKIPGVYLDESYRRFYPDGEISAHVLGFTNVDDRGQEGLELAYNHWLQGNAGKKWVIKDRLGRVIEDVQTTVEQHPGQNLVLSIDRRIQYIAYRELLSGVYQNQATAGSVIVLDVNTAEVLAMVNFPSFNPNQRAKLNPQFLRNRAITDTFEPGSTIKAFSIASGFATGKFNANTLIDTAPGFLRLNHNLVRDEKNNGVLTVEQIMQISSNVGVSKIVLQSPQDQLFDLLRKVGFGEITGVGFPGEENGRLQEPQGAFSLATLSYGYGLAVTPLQLACAYNVLANGGIKKPVSLLKVETEPLGKRVIDAKVAQDMLALMESVLSKGGTGTAARIPGYRIAGKTGTAKLVGKSGYQKHHYESSFVGIAPASKPRIVVAVIIHDPQGKDYLGGPVAGPIFKNVMQETLRILDVPTDRAM